MHIEFTEDQKTLRKQVRQYYQDLFTPDLRARLDEEWEEMGGPVFREVVGHMGRDGWLGIGWPTEYGGKGLGPIEQFIFWDETYRAHAPLPVIGVNTIGPTLMQFGTPEQKDFFLPKILQGEVFFGVGYSEPSAGTDLAALATSAVREGDEYVINGQKVFTTHANVADYIWLAARTDPEAKKHKGISIIVVPTDTPGFSLTPTYTLGGERTNTTFYENVRVPVSNLMGPENAGWSLITSQLNHERIALAAGGIADKMLENVWEWAQKTPAPEGGMLIDQAWVQLNLARVYAKLDALKVLNWHSAWTIGAGIPDMAEASAVKVFGTELFVEVHGLLLEIVNAAGIVKEGEPGALFGGLLESAYRGAVTLTFGGGVNEVQRDIIAMAGLRLPRARR
jgi:alkylation response protein AidB-like acyl-CoA dehydrogenase